MYATSVLTVNVRTAPFGPVMNVARVPRFGQSGI
jgi:hypothetical protein